MTDVADILEMKLLQESLIFHHKSGCVCGGDKPCRFMAALIEWARDMGYWA